MSCQNGNLRSAMFFEAVTSVSACVCAIMCFIESHPASFSFASTEPVQSLVPPEIKRALL